jgi:ribose 5-phosphate isomerase B
MTTLPLAIASDHAGYELKQTLVAFLREQSLQVEDLGTHGTSSVDYPDYGYAMAQWLKANGEGKGILICGSGIGISIAANRHTHVRAALCHDGLSAALCRKHNDANVLCLGARLIGVDVAKDAVMQFLNTSFEGGRHAGRIEKLSNPS